MFRAPCHASHLFLRPTLIAACLAFSLGAQAESFKLQLPAQSLAASLSEVAQQAKGHLRLKAACEAAESRGFPEWVAVDPKALKGTFKALPARTELPPTINESLVVELYSK